MVTKIYEIIYALPTVVVCGEAQVQRLVPSGSESRHDEATDREDHRDPHRRSVQGHRADRQVAPTDRHPHRGGGEGGHGERDGQVAHPDGDAADPAVSLNLFSL